MSYNGKQFTEDMVIQLLNTGHKSLHEIRTDMGCSKSTAENLLTALLNAGKVKRRNVMGEKKPLWMYSLSNTFRIKCFEKKYGMTTEEFSKKFTNGSLGDDMDFFEWKALVELSKE